MPPPRYTPPSSPASQSPRCYFSRITLRNQPECYQNYTPESTRPVYTPHTYTALPVYCPCYTSFSPELHRNLTYGITPECYRMLHTAERGGDEGGGGEEVAFWAGDEEGAGGGVPGVPRHRAPTKSSGGKPRATRRRIAPMCWIRYMARGGASPHRRPDPAVLSRRHSG